MNAIFCPTCRQEDLSGTPNCRTCGNRLIVPANGYISDTELDALLGPDTQQNKELQSRSTFRNTSENRTLDFPITGSPVTPMGSKFSAYFAFITAIVCVFIPGTLAAKIILPSIFTALGLVFLTLATHGHRPRGFIISKDSMDVVTYEIVRRKKHLRTIAHFNDISYIGLFRDVAKYKCASAFVLRDGRACGLEYGFDADVLFAHAQHLAAFIGCGFEKDFKPLELSNIRQSYSGQI